MKESCFHGTLRGGCIYGCRWPRWWEEGREISHSCRRCGRYPTSGKRCIYFNLVWVWRFAIVFLCHPDTHKKEDLIDQWSPKCRLFCSPDSPETSLLYNWTIGCSDICQACLVLPESNCCTLLKNIHDECLCLFINILFHRYLHNNLSIAYTLVSCSLKAFFGKESLL